MDRPYVPSGWPAPVRPPGVPGWEETASAWLLDQAPPEFRGYPVLRRHVVVLARFVTLHVEATQVAVRRGLSEARGVLRDVVCNQIPSAFRDRRPYAVCAFVGGWVYVGLWSLQAPGWVSLVACVGITAGLRGLALWRDWQLPQWRL